MGSQRIDAEFMGNLSSESDDDVSAMIFEQFGMVCTGRKCARRVRGGIVSGADGRPAIFPARASTIRVIVGSFACIESLSTALGVAKIHADQCQFGAVALRGPSNGQPLKKPIGFISNAPEVLKSLDRRCEGRGGECSCPTGG